MKKKTHWRCFRCHSPSATVPASAPPRSGSNWPPCRNQSERSRVRSDLYGLPPRGSPEFERLRAEMSANAVERAITEIPPSERVAMLHAQVAHPFLLSSPRRVLPFLQAEGGDASRAARRIVRYWEERERLLGDDAFAPDCFHPDDTEEDFVRLFRKGFRPTSDSRVNEALRASLVKAVSPWLLGKIQKVEREIESMPRRKKEALLEARERMPDVVDCEHRISAFLEAEDYDPAGAARRMASYWDMKRYLFGSEGLFDGEDEEEDGEGQGQGVDEETTERLRRAFVEECREELESGIIYPLPGHDTFGRGLIMIQAEKTPFSHAGRKRCLKILWHCIIEKARADVSTRLNGIVLVIHRGNSFSPRQVANLETLSRMRQLLFHAIPLRLCAIHECSPPRGQWARSMVIPAIKWLMKQSGRMKCVIHDGGQEEVLEALGKFGIKTEQLPDVLGGLLERENARKWAEERFLRWHHSSEDSNGEDELCT
mmetsp:Transcript_38710/g.71531  ORF Transcript_38710/g.71531 Transcript_38710/m.71531 type:complete len:485 (-) Transcript_38710:432-1886(-)